MKVTSCKGRGSCCWCSPRLSFRPTHTERSPASAMNVVWLVSQLTPLVEDISACTNTQSLLGSIKEKSTRRELVSLLRRWIIPARGWLKTTNRKYFCGFRRTSFETLFSLVFSPIRKSSRLQRIFLTWSRLNMTRPFATWQKITVSHFATGHSRNYRHQHH